VKFTDRETAIKVDVGFKTTISTGPQSVLFIKEKMKEYPQLEFLVLVLKQFLVYHNLLESFNGGISSYCLILLIISYLQMSGSEDDLNHGRDLIQFLELYGCQFNYLRTGIRITDGGSYFRKNDGLAGHADNSYQQYSLLCIEDPLKSENDVGRGCYGAMKVRDAFANAFRELRDAVLPQYEDIQPCGSSILGRILRIPPHIVKYRRIICRRSMAYDTSPLSPLIASMEDCRLIPVTDDRSDSGSCSSQISNLSSRTKSSTSQSMTGSQSSGSGAISDNESDGNSDTSKPNLHDLPQLLTAAVSYSTPADTTAGHTSTVTTTGHIVVTIPSTVVSTGIVTPVPSQVFTARSLQSDLNLTTTVTAVHSSVSSPSNSSVHIYHNRNPRHPVAMTSTTSRNANAERRSRKPGPGSSQSSTDNSSVSANR
jgi:non-canonical poly(A) RNA polymerase PAPD5/7